MRGRGQRQIAPLDAEIVSGPRQHLLVSRSHPEDLQIVHLQAAPGDTLLGNVHGQMRGGIEVERDRVRFAVGGARLPDEVRHGSRKDVQIGGQRGGEKGEIEGHARGGETVVRAGRSELERLLAHGGGLHAARDPAHEAESLPVDAGEAGHGLLGAGPVLGGLVGEPVGHRPDAEVWVVDDQGHGRRAESGLPTGGERQEER